MPDGWYGLVCLWKSILTFPYIWFQNDSTACISIKHSAHIVAYYTIITNRHNKCSGVPKITINHTANSQRKRRNFSAIVGGAVYKVGFTFRDSNVSKPPPNQSHHFNAVGLRLETTERPKKKLIQAEIANRL